MGERADVDIHVNTRDNTAGFNTVRNGLAGLKTAALELAGVLATGLAFKSIIDTTNQWSEGVHTLAKDLGVTSEEASKLQYVGRSVGLTVEDIDRSFAIFAKHIIAAKDATHTGANEFQKLGISVLDARGHTKSFSDLLAEVNTKIGQYGNSIDKTGVLTTLFGRAGREMNDLISLTPEKMAALEMRAESMGLVLSETAQGALHNFRLEQYQLGLAFDAFKIQIGTALIPVLAAFLDMLIKFVRDTLPALRVILAPIVEGLVLMWRAVGSLVQALIDLAAAFLPAEVRGRGVAGVAKVIADAFRVLAGFIKMVADIVRVVTQFFQDHKAAAEAVRDVFLAIVAIKLAEWFKELGEGIVAFGTKNKIVIAIGVDVILLAAMYDEIQKTVKLIQDNPVKMKIAWDTGALTDLAEKFLIGIATMVAFAALALGALPVAIIAALVGVVTYITMTWGPQILKFLGSLWTDLVAGWNTFAAGFKTNWSVFWNDLQTAAGTVIGMLGAWLQGIIKWLDEIIGKIPIIGGAFQLWKALFGGGGGGGGNGGGGNGGGNGGGGGGGGTGGGGGDTWDKKYQACLAAGGVWAGPVGPDGFCDFTGHGGGGNTGGGGGTVGTGPHDYPTNPSGDPWGTPRDRSMAAGGIVTRPTRIVAGDAGPEAVIPLARANLGRMGAVVNVYVSGNVTENERRLGEIVGDQVLFKVFGQRRMAY